MGVESTWKIQRLKDTYMFQYQLEIKDGKERSNQEVRNLYNSLYPIKTINIAKMQILSQYTTD